MIRGYYLRLALTERHHEGFPMGSRGTHKIPTAALLSVPRSERPVLSMECGTLHSRMSSEHPCPSFPLPRLSLTSTSQTVCTLMFLKFPTHPRCVISCVDRGGGGSNINPSSQKLCELVKAWSREGRGHPTPSPA